MPRLRQTTYLITAVILLFAAARGIQRVLTGLALQQLDPWTVTAASLTAAAAIWFPIAAQRGWLSNNTNLWKQSIPLSLVNIVIPGITFTAAQLFVTASVTALLVAALPIIVAIFAAIFLREHPNHMTLGGLAAGTAGVLLLVLSKGGALDGNNWWAGIGLTTIGILSAAAVYIAWRTLLSEHAGPVLLGPQLAISTLAVIPVALITTDISAAVNILIDPTVIALIIALGLVNYVIPQLAMFWLLSHTTAVRSALANYLAPLFATVLAIPVLGQQITPGIVAGGILIIGGAALINFGRSKPKA